MMCTLHSKPRTGNSVEPSAEFYLAEGSDKRLSTQYLRPNIQPITTLVIDLNVRRNQPQCSNFALNIRTRQSHCGSCRSKDGRCRGTNGNSSYIFSAEKCTFIIKYSKVWKWCRTFSAIFFDLNVRHLTCLRSFCVEHSGQLPSRLA